MRAPRHRKISEIRQMSSMASVSGIATLSSGQMLKTEAFQYLFSNRCLLRASTVKTSDQSLFLTIALLTLVKSYLLLQARIEKKKRSRTTASLNQVRVKVQAHRDNRAKSLTPCSYVRMSCRNDLELHQYRKMR